MDESSQVQNRRQRRSNVLMTATLELSGRELEVKLRNLSAEGALVEGDTLPIEGAVVRFRRNELAVVGTIVWVRGRRAGLSFREPLTPEAVLRHVPAPRPRVVPDFRRPGLQTQRLSADEKRFGALWAARSGPERPGE